jgi:hypothetical protein
MPPPETILINVPLNAELSARVAREAPSTKVVGSSALAEHPELWREADVLFTHHIDPPRTGMGA